MDVDSILIEFSYDKKVEIEDYAKIGIISQEKRPLYGFISKRFRLLCYHVLVIIWIKGKSVLTNLITSQAIGVCIRIGAMDREMVYPLFRNSHPAYGNMEAMGHYIYYRRI